jgi:hypothetical protein
MSSIIVWLVRLVFSKVIIFFFGLGTNFKGLVKSEVDNDFRKLL